MKYEDNNEIEFRETGLKRMGRSELAQGRVQQGIIMSTILTYIRVLTHKRKSYLVILEIVNIKRTFT
jgi:hypothetical protein